MTKAGYLPNSDTDRQVWLNNFNNKLPAIAALLGITAADLTALANDTIFFVYLMNLVEAYNTAKEQRVNYKNLIKNGPIGMPGGTLPTAPPIGAAPTVVPPGIFQRVQQLVARIKTSPAYTEAIGHDLGIIGSQQTMDTTTMKPTLKLVIKGGHVEIQWVKGDADGVRIETDKGTGWQFLAVDTVPHYTDTTPITAAATWKYRAMYLVADELVGQWSDVASIAVS